MSYQNDSLFEWFEVLFGKKSCIVAGKEYPLGYFAAEALEIDDALLAELKDLTQVANEEFNVFLQNFLKGQNLRHAVVQCRYGGSGIGQGVGAYQAAPAV